MGFLEVKSRDPDSSADHSYWPSIFALSLFFQPEEPGGIASQGGGFGGITTALNLNVAGFNLDSLDAKPCLKRR